MTYTTPDQITAYVERKWERGEYLRAYLAGEELFPLTVPLKRPGPRDLAEHFGAAMDWVSRLRTGSKSEVGYGYDLIWEQTRNRVQGSNAVPVAAVFATEEDALRLMRRQVKAEKVKRIANDIVGKFPELREWLIQRPQVVLQQEVEWERLLAIADWFAANPKSGLYLRQIDVSGVDTKFIEAHRSVLTEMLDAILPDEAVDKQATGVGNFARRYGLRSESPLVRFRVLDPELYIRGISDMSLPAEQFSRLDLPVSYVFITENRTNGLAFPSYPRSLVIFGLGYGLDRLSEVEWLHNARIWYWGDIDTHGFGILNRLRANLPQARSFLMDLETLLQHRPLWGQEPADKRYEGGPTMLTASELTLFNDLRNDRWGDRVRLEQERIGYQWLEDALVRVGEDGE